MNDGMTEKRPRRQKDRNPLTELDWAILEELTHDPHASSRVVAERLDLPPAQVAARIRELDRRNVSHVLAVLDLKAAGQSFAIILVSLRGRSIDLVAAEMCQYEEVMMASALLGGEYDLLLMVRFVDLDGLHRSLYTKIGLIEGVRSFQASVVLDVPVFRSHYVAYTPDFLPVSVEDNMRKLADNYPDDVLDELDRCIVAELQENARKSINAISRKYSINASTIRYRIRSLESRGLMRFVTVVDPPAVGLHAFALVEIQANANLISQIIQTLSQKSWVLQLFVCAGFANLLAIVPAATAEDIKQIKMEDLSAIDGVDRVRASALIKTYAMDARWAQRIA